MNPGTAFRSDLGALLRPDRAFRGPEPGLGRALARMLVLWVPLALLHATLQARQVLEAYRTLRSGAAPGWLGAWMGLDPEDLVAWLHTLPPPPTLGRLWPWLAVGVPLGVLGTWLHHAVWDHTGLWLLKGLGNRRGFRGSLVAEAEALRITALLLVVDFLAFLPGLGLVASLPLLLVGAYRWVFRGFALAARHGCEPWRGIAATVVHAMLLGGCALGLASVLVFLLRITP